MTRPPDALPDWARAWGAPLFRARIRSTPADFRVDEILPFHPGDEGSHDFLRLEKIGANTVWVARCLARHAGVRRSDVGYAGLKDRHAVTRQWFSVPRSAGGVDWAAFSAEGVRVLEVRRNRRKLRRGMHRANAFGIVLRTDPGSLDESAIGRRMERIGTGGVPNYFGPQRFGRGFGNIALARRVFAGAKVTRDERGIAISAARSFLFNEILHARVAAGTWDRMLDGDIANLDGTGSIFEVDTVDAEIDRRCSALDIHPTATLWGLRNPGSRYSASKRERDATRMHEDLTSGLEALKVASGARPLRLRIHDLEWQVDDAGLRLSFTLRKGAFATAVLREVADCSDAAYGERSRT